jgi:hypothetical protein
MRFGMVILQRGFLGRWKDLLGKDGLAGQKAGWKGFCPRRRSGFRAVAGGAGGIGLFPGFGRRALFGLAALGAMLGLIMPGRGNCVGLNQARGGHAEKDAACGEKERPELSLPGDSSTARPRCSEPEGPTGHFADSSWPMEQIELTGGEIRWGLIDSVDEQWVHWVEIQRPAGRPGYVVVRPVERSLVVRMVRLPETERQRLQSPSGFRWPSMLGSRRPKWKPLLTEAGPGWDASVCVSRPILPIGDDSTGGDDPAVDCSAGAGVFGVSAVIAASNGASADPEDGNLFFSDRL